MFRKETISNACKLISRVAEDNEVNAVVLYCGTEPTLTWHEPSSNIDMDGKSWQHVLLKSNKIDELLTTTVFSARIRGFSVYRSIANE